MSKTTGATRWSSSRWARFRLWWCRTFHDLDGRGRGLGCWSVMEWTCKKCGRRYDEEIDFLSDGRVKRRVVTYRGIASPAAGDERK